MENIKEILKQANQLQNFANQRAIELFKTSGSNYPVLVNSIQFEETLISIELKEISRYDCQIEWISLEIPKLEMNDDEWNSYLSEKRIETLAKEQKRKENAEKAKLEAKQKEFNRLKDELGY